jgi:phosphoglucomutase
MDAFKKNLNLFKTSDKVTKEEKLTISNYSKEEEFESFYKDLEFGTGGLRGIMGMGTNRMNRFTIGKTTLGLANYLHSIYDGEIKVAISYDNRHNSGDFSRLVAGILASQGIKTFIYSQLRPTPVLSFTVRYLKCQGGVMVTASHNPKEYNGYKVYNSDGAQLNIEQSDTMIEYVNKVEDIFNIPCMDYQEGQSKGLIKVIDTDVVDPYLEEVKKIRVNEIPTSATFVFSPLHGTGARITPQFLSSQGYHITPLDSQMICSPNFENTLSSNPEDPKAFIESIKLAESIKADAILVTDPDADRLGVAVLSDGKYVLLSGNQTAAIELHYLVTQRKATGKPGAVYSTIVTTDLLNVIAKKAGYEIIQCLTGFKNICDEVKKREDTHEYIFGCEESFGSLISDFVRDKDSIQACYLLCEIISYYKQQGKTLIDYLDEIGKEYGYYLEKTDNFYFEGPTGNVKMSNIMKKLRKDGLKIENDKIIKIADYQRSKYYLGSTFTTKNKQDITDVSKSDVIKFWFKSGGWLVLRPSGTEPKLKVYYSVVGKDTESSQKVISNIKGQIDALIKKLDEEL